MTEVKIGLETHVQLDTETKLFCSCPNRDAEEPNTHVCPVCLGHPGSKPRLNRAVLEQAVKTSQALQCEINEEIFFSRKTYFYPDLSKNFQITQYEVPVGEEGEFQVKIGDREVAVGIRRLHIEEDPAKTEHVGGDAGDADYSLVDYNRSGTPLLEIVTEPDFRSPEEARAYLQQLTQMLEYLGLYSPESGFAVKSDANVSIEGGSRVEVKNITGTAGIQKALSYEITRQKQLKKRGRQVEQETRSYSAGQEITQKLRQKETEEDYGYIFDPDLTRQELDAEYRERMKSEIPELPHEKFERFQEQYGLGDKVIEALVSEQSLAEAFEELADKREPELTASWLTGELKKTLNYNDVSFSESELRNEWLDYLLELLENEDISERNAEKVLREIVEEPAHPETIIEEEDLLRAGDDQLGKWVAEAIDQNPEAVEDYNSGGEEAVNFLIGQVMNISQGKADPKTSREKLIEQLEEK